MRVLSWLIRVFIFFTLFAFALNNQHRATVHWFFGVEWTAPLVFVVLAAFAAGAVVGVLAMLPNRIRLFSAAPRSDRPSSTAPATAPLTPPPSDLRSEHPPREGL